MTADKFATVGASLTTELKQIPVRAPHYRIKWTIAGAGADYTFSVQSYLV